MAGEKQVTTKLKQIGESIGFKRKSWFRVRPYPDSWRYINIDHVWLTRHPVEVPVVGFEVTTRGRDFSNSKKMKGDIVNLHACMPEPDRHSCKNIFIQIFCQNVVHEP